MGWPTTPWPGGPWLSPFLALTNPKAPLVKNLGLVSPNGALIWEGKPFKKGRRELPPCL